MNPSIQELQDPTPFHDLDLCLDSNLSSQEEAEDDDFGLIDSQPRFVSLTHSSSKHSQFM